MSPLRIIFLGLAVIGGALAVLTYGFFPFLDNAKEIVVLMAMTVWVGAETYVRKDYVNSIVALLVVVVLGAGSGLPLYLFLRLAQAKTR